LKEHTVLENAREIIGDHKELDGVRG